MSTLSDNNNNNCESSSCRQTLTKAYLTTKELYFRITEPDGETLIDLTQIGYILDAYIRSHSSSDLKIQEYNQANAQFVPIALPSVIDDTTINAVLYLKIDDESTLNSVILNTLFTNPQGVIFEHASFLIKIIYK